MSVRKEKRERQKRIKALRKANAELREQLEEQALMVENAMLNFQLALSRVFVIALSPPPKELRKEDVQEV